MRENIAQPVGVSVNHFSLSLMQPKSFLSKLMRKEREGEREKESVKLLRDISADIQGGQLVAIMGGSGIFSIFSFYIIMILLLFLLLHNFSFSFSFLCFLLLFIVILF